MLRGEDFRVKGLGLSLGTLQREGEYYEPFFGGRVWVFRVRTASLFVRHPICNCSRNNHNCFLKPSSLPRKLLTQNHKPYIKTVRLYPEVTGLQFNPDPRNNEPLPLTGIIVGILICRPLNGGNLLIMGLHEGVGVQGARCDSRNGFWYLKHMI